MSVEENEDLAIIIFIKTKFSYDSYNGSFFYRETLLLSLPKDHLLPNNSFCFVVFIHILCWLSFISAGK
jgi:hypothetical protein